MPECLLCGSPSTPSQLAEAGWLAPDVLNQLARGAGGDPNVETPIAERKLVTPHYQHVDGTSFAAPLIAGIAACMLQANSALTPRRMRDLSIFTMVLDPIRHEEPRALAVCKQAARCITALERVVLQPATLNCRACGSR